MAIGHPIPHPGPLWQLIVWALPALLALACSRTPDVPSGIDRARLDAVQAQVDFPVAIPRYLPLGLKLVGAEVLSGFPRTTEKEVHLSFFAYPDGPGLQLMESQGRPNYQIQVEPASIPVGVRDVQGQLYVDPYREGRTFVSLVWQREGITFELWGFLERGLTRKEFLKIAESIQ